MISIIHRTTGLPLPVFSIIVPTFHEEKILQRCLSIFTPERKARYRFELIVSDGGSTDGTIAVAQQYADLVVQYTGTGKQGIAGGRNAGAAHARGNALVFLNGDTIPDAPDNFLAFIQAWAERSHPTSPAPALACAVDVFPEERIWQDVIFYALHNRYVRLLNWVGMGMCRGECQIVQRAAFEKVGGYDSRLKAGEDFELYTRLATLGRIPFVKEIRVFESPRRFRTQGYPHILGLWLLNALSVMFLHRSYSDDWPDVR